MSTSIKVTDRTKSRLERLQAEIRLETGRTITQQELLDRIVSRTYDSKDALIESFREEFEPLSDVETEAWLSGTVASGIETDEEDIDDVLYGSLE